MPQRTPDLGEVHRFATHLWHSTDNEAPELLNAWPLVTGAAHDAAARLGATDPGQTLERIHLATNALAASNAVQQWIEGSRPADAFVKLGRGLERVGSHPDKELAFHLLTSVVWLSAEQLARRLRHAAVDAVFDHRHDPATREIILDGARHSHQRVAATTILSQTARFGIVAAEPDLHADAALGQWDIEAHRVLAGVPSTLVLAAVARVQLNAAHTFARHLQSAADGGHIEPAVAERIHPALNQVQDRWKAVCDTVEPMAQGMHHLPKPFVDAAHTLGTTVVLPPETNDDRALADLFSNYFASNANVAAASLDFARENELHGNARAIARSVAEDPQMSRAARGESYVDPVAIHEGRTVPLPEAYRGALVNQCTETYHAGLDALSASAALDHQMTTQTPTAQSPTTPTRPHEPQPLTAMRQGHRAPAR